MSAIEILASILIAIAVIKIIIFLFKPELWFNFIEKVYFSPFLVSVLGLFASVTVLYLLVSSGITIIEILAVSLFIVLLMMTGLANYADEIVKWAKGQSFTFMMKRLWLYSLTWILLIAWGARELFFV
jgi:hypothetical protein